LGDFSPWRKNLGEQKFARYSALNFCGRVQKAVFVERLVSSPALFSFCTCGISVLLPCTHRYRKSLNRLLKVCYVPTTSAVLVAFFSSFFVVAINSTNEVNKAAGTCR
jgi:hypothetical protein